MSLPAVKIEQTLHGYSDGHRMLAASVNLPKVAQRQMLALSDMSGRSMTNGFESYVTGYPLSGSDYYSLAQTWYAPEMERPGCVWTHSLLIPRTEIGVIEDLAVLTGYFRRPKQVDDVKPYETAIAFGQERSISPEFENAHRTAAMDLICAIYATKSPVLMAVEDAISERETVFAIWSQQWPRLRANFTFSTGSIQSRSIGSKEFDLQLVPEANVREIRRSVPAGVFAEGYSQQILQSGQSWITSAIDDLFRPNSLQLRLFMKKFDSAFDDRMAFVPLVQLSLLLDLRENELVSLERLLANMFEQYPNAHDASELKNLLLASDSALTKVLYPKASDEQILRALSLTESSASFDEQDLLIEKRAQKLWETERTAGAALLDFLTTHDHNSTGERILTAILGSVLPADLIAFCQERPRLLVSAISRSPKLAALPSIWFGPDDRQQEMFNSLVTTNHLSKDVLGPIFVAMLDASSDAALDLVSENSREIAVTAALDWFNTDHVGERKLTTKWQRLIASDQDCLVRWSNDTKIIKPLALALVAELVNATNAFRIQTDFTSLAEAVRIAPMLPSDEHLALSSFSLGRALSSQSFEACILAKMTFDEVHSAAATDRLSYQAWLHLESKVPMLSAWRNWDKCERLRRGLVDSFDNQVWPAIEFLNCAKSTETLRELLRTCEDYRPSGKRLLLKLRDQEQSFQGMVPPDVWKTAKRYFR